jgi:hypothetical protein
MSELKLKDTVYYARILPTSGIYDVLELKIRTVENDWFAGVEKRDKQVFLFENEALDKDVFVNRKDALYKVQNAESKKKNTNEETYYEEY